MAASTVQLQVSDYSQPSDYTVRLQQLRMISEKKKTAYVSITCEEIVMVMTALVTDMLLICIIRKVYINYDTSSASGIFPRRDRDSMITIMK